MKDDYLNGIMGDDILDHPYVNEDPEVISLLEAADQNRSRRYIGEDRPVIQVHTKPTHWSELPKPISKVIEWPEGDYDPRLDEDLEDYDE